VRRSLLLTVVAAGVAVAAAGCGGAAGGTAAPATDTGPATTTSSAAPTKPNFDPCAVLPADGLAKLGITGQAKIDPDSGACEWLGTFDISTHVLPYPLGQRPKKDNPVITPLTIGSHKAEFWRSNTAGWCSVDLALGAAQSFDITVVAADSKSMDTACSSVKDLATAAEPKLPTS
jgi:hypothetical protein